MLPICPDGPEPSSFRDPAGSLFYRKGVLMRRVSPSYRDDYEALMSSGLYEELVSQESLIPHEQTEEGESLVLTPEPIPFISYPFEWSFSQLKDAALLTLRVQKAAFERGLVLKDASAYNVQFRRGRPVFIDTLSFQRYSTGSPWKPYIQFCRNFLAPLSIGALVDPDLLRLTRLHPDGIPLELAVRILPWSSRLRLSLFSHIYLHARFISSWKDTGIPSGAKMSPDALRALIGSLESAVVSLKLKPQKQGWAGYYDEGVYSREAMARKQKIVSEMLEKTTGGRVVDLGANTGVFSRIAAAKGLEVVAIDRDELASELNYLDCRRQGVRGVLPLVIDIASPTPSFGWACGERLSFIDRFSGDDILMCLAFVHHLHIGDRIPLERMAALFSQLCAVLIIEFVPKEDPQAASMIGDREAVFAGYTPEAFERSFAAFFSFERTEEISPGGRRLYLMRKRPG